jgi:hypothetical protein
MATTAVRAPAAGELAALARHYLAHLQANVAFANAVFAHFGHASVCGDILDHHSTLNSAGRRELEDFCRDRYGGAAWQQVGGPSGSTPIVATPAAAAMLAAKHTRPDTWGVVPMPLHTQYAALGYAAERVALLEEIVALIPATVGLRLELRRWTQLREHLVGELT